MIPGTSLDDRIRRDAHGHITGAHGLIDRKPPLVPEAIGVEESRDTTGWQEADGEGAVAEEGLHFEDSGGLTLYWGVAEAGRCVGAEWEDL